MCCGFAFWKRVFAFCLTFGFGILVTAIFISDKACTAENLSPSVKPIVNSAPPENKNCVPVDGNLKYERLTAEEKPDLELKKTEDKKKSLKKEKLNNPAEQNPQHYNPSKDSSKFKNLLHRERCFETQEQK